MGPSSTRGKNSISISIPKPLTGLILEANEFRETLQDEELGLGAPGRGFGDQMKTKSPYALRHRGFIFRTRYGYERAIFLRKPALRKPAVMASKADPNNMMPLGSGT